MKLVEVMKISYYAPAKAYKVILSEIKGDEEFPVIVGTMEAQSIALAIEGINLPRPMTHDLICIMLNKFDAKVDKVIIKNQTKGTFFSQIIISNSNNLQIELDSRPSDAISLALRASADIYVSDDLMKNVKSKKILIEDLDDNLVRSTSIKSEKKVIKNLEEALNKAIKDEEYEVAAKLRDRIEYIKKDY
tara:strand:- start:386 stop:955 length:570 start_codon:yes stop_codon:yes gene_type:complete